MTATDPAPWHVDRTAEGYVARLRSVCLVRDVANRQLELLVRTARLDGVPWEAIASGLNRPLDSVRERYRHIDAWTGGS